MNKVIEDLNWRYAVKKFNAEKKISNSDFDTLKESLRLTPTSYGLQSFTGVVVASDILREKLVEASYGQRQVADASHLFVLCSYSKIKDTDVDSYMQLISHTRNVRIENLDGFSNRIKGEMNARSEQEILNWSTRQRTSLWVNFCILARLFELMQLLWKDLILQNTVRFLGSQIKT